MRQGSPLWVCVQRWALVLALAPGCGTSGGAGAVDAAGRTDVAAPDATPSLDVDVAENAVTDAGTDLEADGGRDAARDALARTDTSFPLPGLDPVRYTGSFPARAGLADVQLTTALEGRPRNVEVYVPTVVGPHPPLLLLFHGTGGSGPEIVTDANAQAAADALGFVVVAPTSNWIGHGDWDHPTEETYWLSYPNTNPDTNVDLNLARACIVEAIRVHHIDENRVYAIGHSSGGFFTTLTAMTLRDRIAAFAENSSGLVRCAMTMDCGFQAPAGPDTCAAIQARPGWCTCVGDEKPVAIPTTPGRQPAAYMGHGTADPLVSVYYTCQLAGRLQALGFVGETHLRVGDGHEIPGTFIQDAWPFLTAHPRL